MKLGDLKVLLFDDQRLKLRHCLSVLRFCGLRDILVAGEVSEAMEIILSTHLDLVLVTHFDGGLGLESLLLELNATDGTSKIPVVAIAPDLGIRYALGILTKGARGILVEPVSRETVENEIKKLSSPQSSQDPLKGKFKEAKGLLEAGDLDNALASFNAYFLAYRSLYPTQDSRYFECTLHLARLYAAKRQFLEAEDQLQTAISIARSFPEKLETHRELPKAYWEYGRLNERRGLLERAAKSHRTALSVNPFFVPSITALLHLLHRRERLDEMIQLLEETVDGFLPYSEPLRGIAEVLNELAGQSVELGRLGMAMALFERLVQLPHGNAPVHLAAAAFFLTQGKTSGVLTHLMEVSKRVKDHRIFFKIADILLESEKWLRNHGRVKRSDRVDLSFFVDKELDEVVILARDALEEGLQLEPSDSEHRVQLGYCLLRLGENASAGEVLNASRESKSVDPEVVRQAIGLMMEGRFYEEAERWLKMGVRRFPNDPVFWQLYASLFKARRMPRECGECLKRGLALQPDHREMILSLARCLQETQQKEAAINLLQKGVELLPEDKDIDKTLKDLLASQQQQSKKVKWFGLSR